MFFRSFGDGVPLATLSGHIRTTPFMYYSPAELGRIDLVQNLPLGPHGAMSCACHCAPQAPPASPALHHTSGRPSCVCWHPHVTYFPRRGRPASTTAQPRPISVVTIRQRSPQHRKGSRHVRRREHIDLRRARVHAALAELGRDATREAAAFGADRRRCHGAWVRRGGHGRAAVGTGELAARLGLEARAAPSTSELSLRHATSAVIAIRRALDMKPPSVEAMRGF